jgi:hypothetical protein
MALAWASYALLLVAVFWLTHGGFEQVKARLLDVFDWLRQND